MAKQNAIFFLPVSLCILFVLLVSMIMLRPNRTTSTQADVVQVGASSEQVQQPDLVRLSEAATGDGTMKLIGKSQVLSEGSVRYSFQVMDVSKNTTWSLFETTVQSGASIQIPFNSWSPDNKKVFIQVNEPEGLDFYVFQANGELYGDGQKYLSVREYWKKMMDTLSMETATGWADPDLLIVRTTRADGTQGPSHWFIISSRKFMQLRML